MRNVATALALGAGAALAIDALLRNALAAAQSPGASALTPWWITGRVVERSTWVLAALLLWTAARVMAHVTARLWPGLHTVTRAAAFHAVGGLMITLPLLWTLATLLTIALRISIGGDWQLDGQILFSAAYYNNVVLGYLPWAAGGVIVIVLSRHVAD